MTLFMAPGHSSEQSRLIWKTRWLKKSYKVNLCPGDVIQADVIDGEVNFVS